MKFGMRLFGNCRVIVALACGLWLCCLLPAAAAQPGHSVPLQTAEQTNSAVRETDFALRFPHPAALIDAIPAVDAAAVSVGRHLAQNKPRLYSAERQRIDPQQQQPTGPPKWRWFLNTGYRQDDLSWSIQGLTPPPPNLTLPQRYSNLLSELTWSDLRIFQLEFGLQAQLPLNFLLKGQLGYGTIFDGSNQDSDYWGDNRTFEFSRSLQDSDSGETWDLSLALGYDLLILKVFKLTPLAGISYHGQNLVMQNGVQVISDYGWSTPLGPFSGLDSTYDTSWYGPWIGLELGFLGWGRNRPGSSHELLVGVEYHQVDYEGDAYWNLRLLNFEQRADGSGIVLYAGLRYFFNSRWALNIDAKYQDWETDPGTDRVWDVFGNQGETVFNGAEWESVSATVGVTCRW